jgi:hypothetical protein
MCNLNGQCRAKKGLCIHEKMMMGGMDAACLDGNRPLGFTLVLNH